MYLAFTLSVSPLLNWDGTLWNGVWACFTAAMGLLSWLLVTQYWQSRVQVPVKEAERVVTREEARLAHETGALARLNTAKDEANYLVGAVALVNVGLFGMLGIPLAAWTLTYVAALRPGFPLMFYANPSLSTTVGTYWPVILYFLLLTSHILGYSETKSPAPSR